jgi:hypothetical protein
MAAPDAHSAAAARAQKIAGDGSAALGEFGCPGIAKHIYDWDASHSSGKTDGTPTPALASTELG